MACAMRQSGERRAFALRSCAYSQMRSSSNVYVHFAQVRLMSIPVRAAQQLAAVQQGACLLLVSIVGVDLASSVRACTMGSCSKQ